MENPQDGAGEISGKRWEAEVWRKLSAEILDASADGQEKRSRLLAYCRNQGLGESSMWERLALYRRHGAAAAAAHRKPYRLFEYKQQRLRQRILALIGELPGSTLGDFSALLSFRRLFLERVEYVSDLLVYFFLEREKGLWRASEDSSVYTAYFNRKLFREFHTINEIVMRSADIEVLQDEYESWLLDQALDEEVVYEKGD